MLEKIDGLKKPKSLAILMLGLVVITFLTKYYGTTDIGDYSDTSRYFAGIYAADIRSSHSYLYGFIHSPLVGLFGNYFVFKITSLIFLLGIVYSVYQITGKDRRALVLIVVSPVVWYMAPWINPIQLASLCLLWAYYFMARYEKTSGIKYAVYAGIFIGLGAALWDTIVFFGGFLVLAYMFNKKFSHLLIVIIAITMGLLPRLILDYFIFNFPFFSLLKSFFGTLTNAFFLGRGTTYTSRSINNIIFFALVFLSIPIYFWHFCTKKAFLKEHKKPLIAIAFSLVLIIINPQIRYTLAILPVIIVLIIPLLSESQWRKQVAFFCFITALFVLPYIVQFHYTFNESTSYDITETILHLQSIAITPYSETQLLKQDLESIEKEYPKQTFLVVGNQDYYQKLAHIYWGKGITELVSVQDYESWQKNQSTLFEKKFTFIPIINDRRSIWIGGGITTNPKDTTDYAQIKYAIALDNYPHQGFSLVKRYTRIALFKRS